MSNPPSPKPQYTTVNSTSALELLHPEIQIEILSYSAKRADIFALIRASPRFLEVYRLNKVKILSPVADRYFHPAVRAEADFCARLSLLQQPLSREHILRILEAMSANGIFGK